MTYDDNVKRCEVWVHLNTWGANDDRVTRCELGDDHYGPHCSKLYRDVYPTQLGWVVAGFEKEWKEDYED